MLPMTIGALVADAPVLKRLEEIGTRPADTYGTLEDCAEIGWLLRLTRALLDSQGELLERFRYEHESSESLFASSLGARYTHHGKQDACKTCQMIARAERVWRGEL